MHTPTIITALSGSWLGALVAIDLIETPAKFKIDGLDRNTAVALGRVVFRRLGFLEMALGAALLPAAWRSGNWSFGLSAALWLITLTLSLLVRPSLERKTRGLDLADPVPAGRRDSQELRRLHRLYVAADGTKMLLLIALLVTAVRG